MRKTEERQERVGELGYHIQCPYCGRTQQKSTMTDSIIMCPKCGRSRYYFLKDDILVSVPAGYLDDRAFYNVFRKQLKSISGMKVPSGQADSFQEM